MAGGDMQVGRALAVYHLGGGVDDAEHLLHVDEALADVAIDPAEHVERAEELGEQCVDQHHVAGGEAAGRPAPDRVAHRAGHHQIGDQRSEEHTSELQSLMRISYAVFCLKKKTKTKK